MYQLMNGDVLSYNQVLRIVWTIEHYGRRLGYEEFKSIYEIPFGEHDDDVFWLWDDFLYELEQRDELVE